MKWLEFVAKLTSSGFVPGRKRFLKLCLGDLARRDQDFEIKFGNGIYCGNLKYAIDWEIYFYGFYEPHTEGIIRQVAAGTSAAARGLAFVDVGANVGYFTWLAAGLFARVYAFEPHPDYARAARQKIARSGLDNVSIVELGLGRAHSHLQYYPPATDNTGTGSFLPGLEGNAPEPVSFEVDVGDDALDRLGATGIALLKVDVEGFEPDVLLGLNATLRRDRPFVITEFSPATRRRLRELDLPFGRLLFPDTEVYRVRRGRKSKWAAPVIQRVESVAALPEVEWPQTDLLIVPREKAGVLRL